jgi:tetrahydromethanopterin S-methyltransferase subunit F
MEKMGSKYGMLAPAKQKSINYKTQLFGRDYPISTQRLADS